MEYITKQCPKCKGELHIPSNLETCICMYCGEAFPVKDEVLGDVSSLDQQSIQADYYNSLTNIADLVENQDKLIHRFTRDQYKLSFEEYTKKGESLLSPAQQFALLSEENREKVVQDITVELLNAITKNIEETKGILVNPTKARVIDQSRFFMAVYLIPMIQYLNYDFSDALADNVIREWIKLYPKYEFKNARYEELKAGFERKGFCFITTATCESLNKPDECYELSSFRRFRDEYMSTTSEGQAIISDYYQIAPPIVTYINMDSNCKEKYKDIWDRYLQHCLKAIEENQLKECEKRYSAMVHDLKNELPYEIV